VNRLRVFIGPPVLVLVNTYFVSPISYIPI
jgi:hypothetical protein